MSVFSVFLTLSITLLTPIAIIAQEGQSHDDNFSKLSKINEQISMLSSHKINHFLAPDYTFTKIGTHHIMVNKQYIEDGQPISQAISGINSVNIYDDEKNGYPLLFKISNQFYSIKGKKIVAFEKFQEANIRVFVSSSRGEFTYFGRLSPNTSIEIRKLSFTNRKPQIQTQVLINSLNFTGNISDFSVAFSITKKLYAITTDIGQIIFFNQHKVISKFSLSLEANPTLNLLHISNHLLVYSFRMIYMFKGSIAKQENLKNCTIPLLDQLGILNIKYDTRNFERFFVMTSDTIYVYEYKNRCSPVALYPLPFRETSRTITKQNFHIAGQMLIISCLDYPQLHIYYNLTDNSVNKLKLPSNDCNSENRKIQVVSKNSDSHILCDMCIIEGQQSYDIPFSCYKMVSRNKIGSEGPADFSKIKTPLLILSLFIVFYFGISRNKASREQSVYQQLANSEQKVSDKDIAALMKTIPNKNPKLD